MGFLEIPRLHEEAYKRLCISNTRDHPRRLLSLSLLFSVSSFILLLNSLSSFYIALSISYHVLLIYICDTRRVIYVFLNLILYYNCIHYRTLSTQICSKGNFLTLIRSYFNFTYLQLYLIMVNTMNTNCSKIERNH